jgi:ferric-dicitrate binding protein FerR (iron transport regulator)
MSKEKLSEELFRFLEGQQSASAERARIEALQKLAQETTRRQPPASTWPAIEQSLAEQPSGVAAFVRAFTHNPRLAAFAVLVAGILVGAFFLLNTATTPTLQLIELTEVRTLKPGQAIIARGMRIESTGSSTVSRESGNTEKIYLRGGSFAVSLQHAELEKPTRFIFPGGSLEPLGTAFTVKITGQGSEVNLTEGKIRILRFDPATEKWQSSEVTSPYSALFASKPVEAVPEKIPLAQDTKPVVQKPRSRFSFYLGKTITLELKNGDRLTGTLRATSGDRLRLVTPSGELNVPESQVQRVQKN